MRALVGTENSGVMNMTWSQLKKTRPWPQSTKNTFQMTRLLSVMPTSIYATTLKSLILFGPARPARVTQVSGRTFALGSEEPTQSFQI